MLSVLLSIMLVVFQALFCAGLGCQSSGHGGAPSEASAGEAVAVLSEALGDLGHIAIDVAFSGVVRVGEGPPALRPGIAGTC